MNQFGINPDDLPENIKMLFEEADELGKVASKKMGESLNALNDYLRNKTMRDDNIRPHELDNAIMPISNLMHGYKPVVAPFEIRGGPDDGKRIVTLCVQLADNKTVMPVLQVPDFDILNEAEYVGSIEEMELVLPEDAEGIGWQKTVSEHVESYLKIHGGTE